MKLFRHLVGALLFTPNHVGSPLSLLHSHCGLNPGHRLKRETDFEAFLDESTDQVDLQERADYDAYCRRELPRLVRARLVSVVASQLQALESALRTQLDEIIENCLEQLSASYEASRTTTTGSNRNDRALPASVPMRSLAPPAPMEGQYGHNYNSEMDNVLELQNGSGHLVYPSQYPDQPPTPSGSAMHSPYGQPDGIITSLRFFGGIENSKLDSNPAPMCFCRDNVCSCPFQRRPVQEQEQHCLPPAALQVKAPTKILRNDPVLGNWNPDDFSMGEGLGMDEMNFQLGR
jgi:hypothetical protein